jgi:hypothetical protein
MVAGLKRNAIHQLLRLLGTAGVALIWLAIPAIGGPPATSVGREHPKSFTLIDNSRLLHTLKSQTGLPFEKFIRFRQNEESFIYGSTSPEGSGAFMTEAIFWIAPDGALHPIVFEHAGRAYENHVTEREFILTGGPGIEFSNGRLRFEFFIAKKGDPHCCPTAGKISGVYKIIGEKNFNPKSGQYSCTFKLVVDRYKRDIVTSDGDISEK